MSFNTMYKRLACVLTILLLALPNAAAVEEPSYLVLEKTYAFASPVGLLEQLDVLLEKQRPVIIGVMPVYQHTDYPAMLEFVEVLRYAQSRGCRIMLHFPLIQTDSAALSEVRTILETQAELLTSLELHPCGILMGESDAAYDWMAEELETVLPVFRVEENALEYYDEALKKAYPLLRAELPPLAAYSYTAEEIPTEFDFQRDLLTNISYDLQNQNRVLMLVVTGGVIIFLAMIVYARRRNRKDFFQD